MHCSARPWTAALLLLGYAACQSADEPAKPAARIADPAVPVTVTTPEPSAAPEAQPQPQPQPVLPPAPSTEEELVMTVARAIAAQDLDALGDVVSPELVADLRRLRDPDPEQFWQRGRTWVDNVKSGFQITACEDDVLPRWRCLIRFGNGKEETVTFTRIHGKMRIDEL